MSREVPLYHKADWASLNADCELFCDEYLSPNPREGSVSFNWIQIRSTISQLIRARIPHKAVGSRFHLPYITRNIKRKIRLRQRVYKRHKKHHHSRDKERCKALRREINRDLEAAYSDYINNLFDTADDKPGAMKRFYRFIKSLRNDATGVSTLKVAGRVYATAKEKADACNRQFQSPFSTSNDPNPPHPPGPALPAMPHITVTVPGVLKLLKSLNLNKASGPDNIAARVLKECASTLSPVIADFYQQTLDEGEVPADWKQQRINPIFKKVSWTDPANYRPVALTCILCKSLEHIIASQLHTHLDRHKFLCDNQHGFRKYRSCETQLYSTITYFVNALEKGNRVDSIVLDFSKAFDKVHHGRLLAKLRHCGVNGKLHKWVTSWLHNREQCVVIDGAESEKCEVASGVPQGSVLGPLFFIIYINDIVHGLNSNIRLFANDALLYRTIHSENDHQLLQQDLDALCAWADRWSMEFNTNKCYSLHIMTKHQKRKAVCIPYKMGGHLLERVTDTKYLGVSINEHIQWNTHINTLVGQAHSKLAFLERNLRSCPQLLKDTAYKTLVRPGIEYASAVWDPSDRTNIKRLDTVQRHAARFVHAKPQKRHANHMPDVGFDYVSVSALIQESGWPTLESRRRHSRCILMHKILSGTVEVSPHLIPKPVEGRTRAGAQKKLPHVSSNTELHRVSFIPRTTRDWNALPIAARLATTVDEFKAAIKP